MLQRLALVSLLLSSGCIAETPKLFIHVVPPDLPASVPLVDIGFDDSILGLEQPHLFGRFGCGNIVVVSLPSQPEPLALYAGKRTYTHHMRALLGLPAQTNVHFLRLLH